MKKIALLFILSVLLISPALAGTHGRNGKVSGRSVGASLCSLIIRI